MQTLQPRQQGSTAFVQDTGHTLTIPVNLVSGLEEKRADMVPLNPSTSNIDRDITIKKDIIANVARTRRSSDDDILSPRKESVKPTEYSETAALGSPKSFIEPASISNNLELSRSKKTACLMNTRNVNKAHVSGPKNREKKSKAGKYINKVIHLNEKLILQT